MNNNAIILGDCLEIMRRIPDKSIDMILCDLPYGTTACSWDTVIPFAPMWAHYNRIIRPRGAIVLTASQPFTSAPVMSNPKGFRHEWIWDKRASSPFNAKVGPLKTHESIIVFGPTGVTYFPTMRTGRNRTKGGGRGSECYNGLKPKSSVNDQYYPTSIIEFSNGNQKVKVHPAQKPVALFEYLIKTYTNPGALILDNCAGSGTTGVAAINTGRRFILIEKEPKYIEICRARTLEAENEMRFMS